MLLPSVDDFLLYIAVAPILLYPAPETFLYRAKPPPSLAPARSAPPRQPQHRTTFAPRSTITQSFAVGGPARSSCLLQAQLILSAHSPWLGKRINSRKEAPLVCECLLFRCFNYAIFCFSALVHKHYFLTKPLSQLLSRIRLLALIPRKPMVPQRFALHPSTKKSSRQTLTPSRHYKLSPKKTKRN